MRAPRARAFLLLGTVLAAPACGGGPTGIALERVRVEGTVTSTADGQPLAGVGVVLTFPVFGGAGGRGRSATSWTDSLGGYAVEVTDFACIPGSLDLGVALPAGYRLPADLEPASIACVEEVQLIDFALEPIS